MGRSPTLKTRVRVTPKFLARCRTPPSRPLRPPRPTRRLHPARPGSANPLERQETPFWSAAPIRACSSGPGDAAQARVPSIVPCLLLLGALDALTVAVLTAGRRVARRRLNARAWSVRRSGDCFRGRLLDVGPAENASRSCAEGQDSAGPFRKGRLRLYLPMQIPSSWAPTGTGSRAH